MHEDVRPAEGDLRAGAKDQCQRRADRELAFDQRVGAREQVRAPDCLGVVRRQVRQRLVEQDRVRAQREARTVVDPPAGSGTGRRPPPPRGRSPPPRRHRPRRSGLACRSEARCARPAASAARWRLRRLIRRRPRAKPASAAASSAKWRAGVGGAGGALDHGRRRVTTSARAVFARSRRARFSGASSAASTRPIARPRSASGSDAPNAMVELRAGPPSVDTTSRRASARCSSVHVILATAVACSARPISTSAGVATSLATVRIDTETSEPSASSAARASAPGSGVAAS